VDRSQAACYDIVEFFNNEGLRMATVNFSVPEDIKQAFQETFANENRSAVIARLMQQAVDDKKRQQRRADAIDALLDLRRKQRPVSERVIARARQADRP
jgi:metal-responsive CopG/Arc/MetJ family transcriptional regulator